jgi:hypothetical protein
MKKLRKEIRNIISKEYIEYEECNTMKIILTDFGEYYTKALRLFEVYADYYKEKEKNGIEEAILNLKCTKIDIIIILELIDMKKFTFFNNINDEHLKNFIYILETYINDYNWCFSTLICLE